MRSADLGTGRAQAMVRLESMHVKLTVRYNDKGPAGLVETDGSPTLAGVQRLWALVDDINAVLVGHLDNTNAPCRIDLRGHDCCYTCNAVEDMIRATVSYFDEIQQEMRDERKGKP